MTRRHQFATHLLGAHPDIQKQCQKELDDIMGRDFQNLSVERSKDLSEENTEYC